MLGVARPIEVIDGFGDRTLSCCRCKNAIIFTFSQVMCGEKPKKCKHCGADLIWKEIEGVW